MLGELTKTEIDNLLTSQVTGRLACTDGERPYVVPVTYKYTGEYIYGQTNEGMKLDILRKNGNVCFLVDSMTDMRNWQSVIIYGKFEELENEEAEAAQEIFFNRIFPLMTSSTVHPHEHEVTAVVDDSTRIKYKMYRIVIEEITGRFEKQ